MYGGGNQEKALAAFGLPASAAKSFEEVPCEIWPQNWKTFLLFVAMGTQWRTGMGGATGLDYAALPVAAKAQGIKLTRGRMEGVRAMESEALRVMGEARENSTAKR